ncbi:unnamed protein product [Dovyalis caffra]|uniref:Uncharacterized protein n=1 Tax=Dovyalis caffra TaxID=77055 RepID=A0AAV1SRP6_9ROSI|nr:unnamed protein product [Dovyalis caffra]
MRARLVVFPVKGRNWCFGRSIDRSVEEAASSHTPSTLKHLWKKISSSSNSSTSNVELVIDYASNKMNKAWTGLEKAPEGTFKNKLYGLNARLVRRRLRHIATRKYFYGSVTLLPVTSALAVLPLPNIPFFWLLFRSYSHWRALKGSEKLLQLVSDCSYAENSAVSNAKGSEPESEESKHKFHSSQDSLWVLQPSKELEELLNKYADENGLNDCTISDICKTFNLNAKDVSKFRHSM